MATPSFLCKSIKRGLCNLTLGPSGGQVYPPTYYAYFDGVNNYGLLDGSITLTGAFALTIKSTFSPNGFWIFTTKSATASSGSGRLIMTSSGDWYAEGTIVSSFSSEEISSLCDGEEHVITIYRDASGYFTFTDNGETIGTQSSAFATDMTFDSFFAQYYGTTSIPFFEGYPEYIKLDDSNMWTFYNSYSKDTLTVNDSIGSNDITLYNFQEGDFVRVTA